MAATTEAGIRVETFLRGLLKERGNDVVSSVIESPENLDLILRVRKYGGVSDLRLEGGLPNATLDAATELRIRQWVSSMGL
jgi:hypothetical protein